MIAILVPFIETDKEGKKSSPYTGMYNLDMNHVMTIEPDEDGDTIIVHKNGTEICIKVPCEEVLFFIARVYSLDTSFMKFISKYDKKISGIIEEMKTK